MKLGNRGEGWVILQFFLFGILLYTTRYIVTEFPLWLQYCGAVFLAIGGFFGTGGVISLGRNLTPFPKPRESGSLVTTGIYKYVRHPIYTGLIFGTLGWSLIISNLYGVIVVAILFLFFDAKTRREEKWLVKRHPEYEHYKQQVNKLIPWIY